MSKKFCLKCGRALKFKGRRSPNYCDSCLLIEYNKLKKYGKKEEKEEIKK